MIRIHREYSLSQSHKTFHTAVAFVLEAQPLIGEEHELQHWRELDKLPSDRAKSFKRSRQWARSMNYSTVPNVVSAVQVPLLIQD